MSLQQNIDYEQKISNIRARVDRAYLPEKNDSYALSIAMGDIKFLLEEIERLRADISDASKERTAVVAFLRERANAEHPVERGVPSLSPAGRGLLLLHADCIERGEHLKENP